MSERYHAIVVGGGPAGLAAASLLAQAGAKTALIAETMSDRQDPRTVALMLPSLRLLAELGLWPGTLAGQSAPLRKLRLIDDTGSSFHAPDLTFAAEEIGEDAFGWNVPLASLIPALAQSAEASGAVIHEGPARGLVLDAAAANVTWADDHQLSASVVLAADGRSSGLRNCAGISVTEWKFDQTALALSFGHSAPHHDISSEYHREAGPFTTVPLPDRRSSLVWMERPRRALALMALDDAALAAEIQIASHGNLGRISDLGPRGAFPISGLRARTMARNRVMLIGEAGHVVPPVGAQGLNMSLRDAALAAELIAGALGRGDDPGDAAVLAEYSTRRLSDILSTQSVIDLMNRSLIWHLLPLEAGRALSLAGLTGFGPLRRYVLRRGIGSGTDLPFTMR